MSIEQALLDSLARIAMQTQIDQWGNTIESPLSMEMRKWANNNREDIASELVKLFEKDKFAEMVASKVVDELSKGSRWNANYEEQQLKDAIMEKVASKLAEEQIKKLTNF